MAVMAPRVLFRERGSSMRSEAVTGSFTGAAACGAPGAEVGARLRVSDAPQAQTNRNSKDNVTRMRFIEISLTCQIVVSDTQFGPLC